MISDRASHPRMRHTRLRNRETFINAGSNSTPRAEAAASHSHRISFLDGWRGVAILLVLGFHYFRRWTPPQNPVDLYPYGDLLANVRIFISGGYGVELFFVISGFVIALTLNSCTTGREFAVRRFARLFPAMALCSLVTYLVIHGRPDTGFVVSAWNFLPSLTFLDPHALQYLVSAHPLAWMDDSYWSLFVEVKFYLLVALVYFVSPPHFPRNLFVIAILIALADAGLAIAHAGPSQELLRLALPAEFLPWFLVGVGCFLRYRKIDRFMANSLIFGGVALLLLDSYLYRDRQTAIAGILIPAIFVASFHSEIFARLLSSPWLRGIGEASYSLYLLHQKVGVASIRWLSEVTHLRGPPSVAIALVVAVGMILLSRIIYVLIEKPCNRALVSRFARRAPQRALVEVARDQATIPSSNDPR